MEIFQGLSAFPITPADEDGVVDAEGVMGLSARLAAAGVDTIGLLGSTGTYAYLTRTERRRAIQAAMKSVGGTTPLIVGVGALRTDEAQNLARDAQFEGASALLLAPVSYTPLTEDEVFAHYAAVASATSLPLCIYNNPSTTHFTFSPALLGRLAGVANIKAVKMPLPGAMPIASELDVLRAGPAGRLAIGYSGDWGAAEALLAGADAWYSVVAGFLPEISMQMVRAARDADRQEVSRINGLLEPLWGLFRQFGSLRVAYAAVNALGLSQAAPPKPILPLSSADRQRTVEALAHAGLG
ncbi:MAG TPA: dihydrodipicolinate synthase family protein [Pelagibacterium sp.]|uniref:dihydrodipicolinate synthase family protein n=1 Tax=Pelagibacterium sp. TaxID=1967288 RepID=UPI002D03A656|nr:dihydrodipicolinate synthase family protein [Pelagibacterium sp.]HWJ88860.1 dihydrodipicolinate synthase family protein [Pelagibacterium sp.]